MKISVLVLIHNAEKYIEKCARSLFGQTYADIEYVFVDDATPDRSMDLLERVIAEYPSRAGGVRIVTNPHNMGIAASRNKALEKAAGDYVLFVDSDDWLDVHAVEMLAAKALAEDADIVVYDSVTVFRGFEYLSPEAVPHSKEEYIRKLLYREARAAMWAKMIRRELFTRHSLRFVEGMDYGEDFYLSPILAYYAQRIVKSDKALYFYLRHNTASISYTLSPQKVGNIILAGELLDKFFSGVPESAVYAPMIKEMKVRSKAAILQAGNKQVWKDAAELYPELDYREFALPASQRMILWLTGKKMWRAMTLYKKAGKLIKRMKTK